ncbi:Glyoxylate reductase [Scedosporium apiospermum]|uniref:Glyoxylate reductase n=1 Tax=Pseudallescheria apiosperma TaxID=563466 RepID=A0A084GHF5_PSEDA|nr:Glyoxylate reductase [Scedosporium apiospermum]KEZ46767.1 Glyoxylate reductase [Scedosporium apiospermum]
MGSSGRPKVLQLGLVEHAHETWSSIGEIADIIVPKATNRDELIAECRSGAFDGVKVAYRTFYSVTGLVDTELIAALPSSLRFICHCGAGYDSIDIPACTDRSILVSNTPTAVDDATADLNIWLMLGALRNLSSSMTALRAGTWRGNPPPAFGHDPQGKVLGILGMGGIGRNMAKKALAFGMRIRYYNRTRLAEDLERECEAEFVDFETLLRESDVLSLNLPLNPQTRHSISKPQFAIMKKGIVIVNTARGAVIDEAALVDALADGTVSSVGLDVYENEPEIHPGLVTNPSVLLVPHMGTWTVETQTKMEEWAMGNVRVALAEGRLRSVVPEQKGMAEMWVGL